MFFRPLIIILCLLLASCFGPKTPQEIVVQADSLIASNQYEEAIIVYKNAIQDKPSFMQARFNLGLIYFSLGDLSSAETFFVNAYDAGYSREQVVHILAATFFQQNNIVALKNLIDTENKSDESKTKQSAALNLQMALYDVLYLLRREQIELAKNTLNQLILSLKPSERECELCLITRAHLQSYDFPSEAISTLDELLLNNPQNAQAYLLRGQLYFALRNPAEAMSNFKRFQTLRPKAAYVQFLIAVTALQMKDNINATKYIDNLLAANPNQPFVNHLKALIVFEQKNYDDARKYAEKSIDRGLKSPANYVMAGVSAYHQNKLEIAYKHLLKGVAFYPENAQLQQLLMFIQFKFGYLEEAGESYLKQDGRSVQNLLLGNLMAYQFMQDGELDQAGNVLDYLANTPMSQPAIRLQTQALQNQLTRGRGNSLGELVAKVQSTSSEETLVRIILLIQSNAIVQAQTEAQLWLAQDPQNLDALNVLAYVFQQLGQAEKANPLLAQALEINPYNTPSLFFLAEQALLSANYQQANLHYRTILQTNPQNLSALRALLQLTFKYQQAPNWDEVLASVNPALISDDQIVALSDAMFQWQHYQGLDNLLMEYSPQSEWSNLVWMVWLKNTFYLYGADKFKNNFNTFYQKNTLPNDVIFALSILENQRQFTLVLKLIEKLPESIQLNDAILLQKALAMLELQRFEETSEILSRISSEQKFRATKWYIQGRQMEKMEDFAQAANYLTAYYESLPNFHSVNALATVLVKAKRYDALLLLAKDYLAQFPADNSATLSLALQLAPTNPAFALQLLDQEQISWLIERNWKLSNNVAWLYFTQQAPEKAIRYSSNALALNAENNQVKVVHANILIKLDRASEALLVLREAKQPDINIENLINQLKPTPKG